MNFAELLEAKGMKANDLAVKLGVHAPTVYMWKAGRKDPSAENLVALHDVLGPEVLELYRHTPPTKVVIVDNCQSVTQDIREAS